MTPPQKRWLVTIYYLRIWGPVVVRNYVNHIDEIQELVESGPPVEEIANLTFN